MQTKPLPPYQALSVREAKRRINIAEGSVRSTKTVTMNIAWIKFLLELKQLDGALLMVGKTERTLKRNVLDPLRQMLGRNKCKLNAGTGELQLLGKTVYIAGANDERAMEKIAGLTVQAAYCDEMSMYPASFWKMLNTRLSLENSTLFGTTNPESPFHYLKTDVLDKAAAHLTSTKGLQTFPEPESTAAYKPLDVLRMTFKLTDNPFLPENYIPELLRTFTGLWRRRYIDGEWVIAEGAIYEMFDPFQHVKTLDLLAKSIRVVGIDYGTTNPFSAHAIEIRPEGLYVFAEYYEKRPLTDSQLSKNLQTWITDNDINPSWICLDPSAASFRQQLHIDKVRNIANANNDVLDGIRVIASLLSQNKLFIAPWCTAMLNEIPGYSWDPKASEKGLDQPIKQNDHACDDLRYGVNTTRALWKPILRTVVA